MIAFCCGPVIISSPGSIILALSAADNPAFLSALSMIHDSRSVTTASRNSLDVASL